MAGPSERTRRISITSVAVAAAILLLAVGVAQPAAVRGATTFVVNRIGDASDLNLGNGICDVSTQRGRQCTLRAAIQQANATPGIDTINFKITSKSKVIAPGSPLPAITEQVTINGYSQTGASANTLLAASNAVLRIVLDGINAGPGANGLEVAGYRSVVKGLVIQRFDGNGILLSATKAIVSGNFIGTNAAGTTDRGNGIGVLVTGDQSTVGGGLRASRNVISGNGFGVRVLGTEAIGNAILGNLIGTNAAGSGALGNDQIGVHVVDADLTRIGGTSPEQRNIISGNQGTGIALQSDSNIVVGNRIGTTAVGSGALGNTGNGISVVGGENQIGGTSEAARNLISANGGHGISVHGADGDNVIQGNRIGSKADGSGDLGNSLDGIFIFGPDETVIGGATGGGNLITGNGNAGIEISSTSQSTVIRGNGIFANDEHGIEINRGPHLIEANVIQVNGGAGVFVTGTASGVSIRANHMVANDGLGIDLQTNPAASGVTNNDSGDTDSGPNGLQNFPVLQSAIRSSATNVTTVAGTLNSTPNIEFRIELFIAAADPTGFGEGQIFVAARNITTNSSGSRNFTFASGQLPVGTVLTATATPVGTGSTSEFSRNIAVQFGP